MPQYKHQCWHKIGPWWDSGRAPVLPQVSVSCCGSSHVGRLHLSHLYKLSAEQKTAVSQLHATTLLSAPCPLLWGAVSLTGPNLLVTTKHSREDPAARIRSLPTTTSRIPRSEHVTLRVNALVCASKQSLFRNPNCPTPSPLQVHMLMVQGLKSGTGWSAFWIFRAETQDSQGHTEFTRPWRVDIIYEPFDVVNCVANKKCALHTFIPQKMTRMFSTFRSVCTFCSFYFQFALVFRSPLGLAPSQHLVSFFVLLLQSVTSCYLALSCFLIPLCGLAQLLLPLGTGCLPLRAYIYTCIY